MSIRAHTSKPEMSAVHYIVIALALLLFLTSPMAQAAELSSSVDAERLAKHRQTDLGLYLTSNDAHQVVTQDPSVIFIDVRTTAEFGLVGHPVSIDRNIPFANLGESVNPSFGQYGFVRNPHFVSQVEEFVTTAGGSRATNIILICRSGSRSKHSVNLLARAGFSNVWSVVDGFEGGTDKNGHRTIEGWRNVNLPWAYKIEQGQAHRAFTQ